MVFLKNDKVELRIVTKKEYELTQEKLNDQEITKYMQNGIYPITFKSIGEYDEYTSKNGLYLAIYASIDHSIIHVGNITLEDIHPTFRFADISILVWNQNRGFATEAVKLISDHAMNRMNIHRLGMGAAFCNIGCIKAFEKNGFIKCGYLHDYYFFDGKYQDVILMEKIKKEGI